MKQNLILVVILLAMLSMVNAIPRQLHKRATTFGPCLTGSPNAITVSLQPDPPVPGQDCLFTVTGTINNGSPINTGSTMVVQAFDSTGTPINNPISTDICGTPGFTCPATSFSIIQSIPIAAGLAGTYSIAVSILDPSGANLGCSMGTITG